MANDRVSPTATHIEMNPMGTIPSHNQGGPSGGASASTTTALAPPVAPPARRSQLRHRPIDGPLSIAQPRPAQRSLAVVAAITPLRATQAHALPDLDAGRHRPQPNATAPALIRPLRNAALQTPLGEGRRPGRRGTVDESPAALRALMTDVRGAKDELRALFGDLPSTELENLLAALLPTDGSDPTALQQRAVLGAALAAACGQDPVRARRVLDILDAPPNAAASQAQDARLDLFATQRMLATSGVGVDLLLAQRPQTAGASGPQAEDSALHQDIRRQAEMSAYASADQLLKDWPRGVPQPESLDELMQVCNHIVDIFPNDDMPGQLRDDFCRPVSHAENASLLSNTDDVALIDALANKDWSGHAIATHGLLAACRLREDPGFDLDAHEALQLPYLAARNHIFDEATVNQVGARFFKLLTYADRAAGTDSASWLEEVTGRGKNPLGGVPRGAAGQMLREPEEDFAKLEQAFAPLIAHLDSHVAALLPAGASGTAGAPRPRADAIDAAVRSAVLGEWLDRIGQYGWQDDMKLGDASEAKILRRAESALSLSAGDLKRDPSAVFVQDLVMNAGRFQRWATDAGMEADFDTHRSHVDHMRNRGDTLTPRVSSDDYLFGVRDVIDGTRMTYGARFTETRQRGINANVSAIVNQPGSDKTVLPPGVPTAAVGPAVRLARTTGASVNAGSSALAGALEMTSLRGVSGWAGVSAIASWTLWKSFGPSVGGTLLPVVADVSRFSGAALRSRIHHGTDLERWRTILLSAFDAMYGTNAETRTVSRPATANAMLLNLAKKHHTDPYVSFGPFVGGTITIAHSVAVNGALRGKSKKSSSESKGGSSGSVTANVTSYYNRRARDTAGVISTDIVNRSVNGGITTGVTTGVSMPAALTRRSGAVFAPINLGTTSAVLFPHSRGGTFRFSMENGKVAPTTIFDTEFADVGDFMRYADSRRDEWLAWTDSKPDPAAALDDYLTRVLANGTTGKLLLAERVILQPAARERIDFLLSMRAHAESVSLPENARARQQRLLTQAIDAELEDSGSWGPRFLYVLESNGTQVALGMSYWIEYLNVQENASNRQLSAFRADNTRAIETA